MREVFLEEGVGLKAAQQRLAWALGTWAAITLSQGQ